MQSVLFLIFVISIAGILFLVLKSEFPKLEKEEELTPEPTTKDVVETEKYLEKTMQDREV